MHIYIILIYITERINVTILRWFWANYTLIMPFDTSSWFAFAWAGVFIPKVCLSSTTFGQAVAFQNGKAVFAHALARISIKNFVIMTAFYHTFTSAWSAVFLDINGGANLKCWRRINSHYYIYFDVSSFLRNAFTSWTLQAKPWKINKIKRMIVCFSEKLSNIYSRLDKNCLNIIFDMRRDVQHEACSAKFMCVKIEIQFNEQ